MSRVASSRFSAGAWRLPASSLSSSSVSVSLLLLLSVSALGAAGCDSTIGEPYTAVVDASPGDGGVVVADADAPPAPTCDDSYGTAPDYVLCEERADSCVFSATTNGGTCDQLCAGFGRVCLEAFDNDPGAPCVANPGDNCGTAADDEICVCSRL